MSQVGVELELIKGLFAIHKHGVVVMVDVVYNHFSISKVGVTSKEWDTFAFTDIFISRRAKTHGSKP
jgi:1,4-alpha-glucan branching enzyme